MYYIVMVDDASYYTTVEGLKTKNEAIQTIKDYLTHLKVCRKNPLTIQINPGGKFNNAKLKRWCKKQEI